MILVPYYVAMLTLNSAHVQLLRKNMVLFNLGFQHDLEIL